MSTADSYFSAIVDIEKKIQDLKEQIRILEDEFCSLHVKESGFKLGDIVVYRDELYRIKKFRFNRYIRNNAVFMTRELTDKDWIAVELIMVTIKKGQVVERQKGYISENLCLSTMMEKAKHYEIKTK